MRVPVAKLDPSSVARCQRKMARQAGVIRQAALSDAQRTMKRIRDTAEGICPVATGETQGSLHEIGPEDIRGGKRVGVGFARTENEQVIRLEWGSVNLHRTMEEHDPGGRRCSSGVHDWLDESEPVDVRGSRPLNANAEAQTCPLGRAILAVCGPVVDLAARFSFRKGVVNVYPKGMSFGLSPLAESLQRAISAALRALGVVALALAMQPPFYPPVNGGNVYAQPWRVGDVAGWQTVLAETLEADTLVAGLPIRLDASQGPPSQYLTLHLHLQGTPDEIGLCGYLVCGEDSALSAMGPMLTVDGDTMWFLSRWGARSDTGRFSVVCDAQGGNWARAVFLNIGESAAAVNARVWKKP